VRWARKWIDNFVRKKKDVGDIRRRQAWWAMQA